MINKKIRTADRCLTERHRVLLYGDLEVLPVSDGLLLEPGLMLLPMVRWRCLLIPQEQRPDAHGRDFDVVLQVFGLQLQ